MTPEESVSSTNAPEKDAPDWRPLYQAALLETDSGLLPERIATARNAILSRIENNLPGWSRTEQHAMSEALVILRKLAEMNALGEV